LPDAHCGHLMRHNVEVTGTEAQAKGTQMRSIWVSG
jgi:hypothetical protein